jgi:hypothetical protein
MSYTRRILPRRPEDSALLPPEGEQEPLPVAPRAAALSPAQVLALQRSGVGNRLLAREINGKDDDEDEDEQGGGGYPLLLTDRPWEEIERERALRNAPIPQVPQLALEFPIVLPAESLPPEMRAMFGLDQPAGPTVEPPEAPDIDDVEAAPEPEKPEIEAEKTETETEEPQAEPEKTEAQPAPKKKKRKGKKGPAQQAAPAPAPPSKALHEMSVDEVFAEINKKAPGTQSGGAKKKPQQQPPQKKKSAAQRAHEKEQAAKRTAQQAKDEELERAAKERKKEELDKEVKAVAALKPMLTHAQTTLTGLRNGLPPGAAYNAMWTEAHKGVQDVAAFNKDVAPTAKAATLQAKLDEVNKLISKVQNFQPPETPQQRRDRKFNEMTMNVPLRMGEGEWAGPFGPEVNFTVDKHDNALWTRIRNHFGRDTVVVPDHDKHQYPHKTATSEVRYYVTGTSNTASIAYDISLHVWDKNDANQWVKVPFDATRDAVYVLHIPHKPN